MQLCRHSHFSSSVFPNMPVRNLFVSSFFPFLFLFASCSIETFPSVFPKCAAKSLSVLCWNLQLCASTESSACCAHLCNCCVPFVHSMLAPTRYNIYTHILQIFSVTATTLCFCVVGHGALSRRLPRWRPFVVSCHFF